MYYCFYLKVARLQCLVSFLELLHLARLLLLRRGLLAVLLWP